MLSAEKYLPIGSIVLLKNGRKKAMIIGIMQSVAERETEVKEFDYIGIMYPEGYLNADTMFLFNHLQITDVVFRGYENAERDAFIQKLDKNMKLVEKLQAEQRN